MIYIRSDLCIPRINTFKDRSSEHWSSFKTEFIALQLKLERNWITVVGMYKPPSVPKTVWKCEISSIFEATIAIISVIMKLLVQFKIYAYLFSDRINISLNLYGLWRDVGFLTKHYQNALSCLYGNISEFFDLQPPTLQEHFA